MDHSTRPRSQSPLSPLRCDTRTSPPLLPSVSSLRRRPRLLLLLLFILSPLSFLPIRLHPSQENSLPPSLLRPSDPTHYTLLFLSLADNLRTHGKHPLPFLLHHRHNRRNTMHRPGPSTYSRSNSPAPSAGGSTGSGRPGTVRRGGRGGGGGYGGGSLWKQRRGGRRGHSTAFASYGSSAGSTSARAESVISQHQQDAAPTLAGRIDALDHAEDEGAPVGGRIQLVGADEEWITCVSEARSSGSRIVGVAAFQPSTASCVLTQLSDSQTYIKTVHTLSVSVVLSPSALLFSPGLSSPRLATFLSSLSSLRTRYISFLSFRAA